MPLNFIVFSKTKCHQKMINKFRFSFKFSKNKQFSEIMTNHESDFRTWNKFLKLMLIQTTFHDDYDVTKMIGQGNFSRVWIFLLLNFTYSRFI